jgi:hypothetical protein
MMQKIANDQRRRGMGAGGGFGRGIEDYTSLIRIRFKQSGMWSIRRSRGLRLQHEHAGQGMPA